MTMGLLSTSIYYKPTNTFFFPPQYKLYTTTYFKGIAIGEMTRVIRNTTSPIVCQKYSRRLMKHFMHRGYSKHILRTISSMKHTSRDAMLVPKRKKTLFDRRPTPLSIQFLKFRPSVREILASRWRITYNDFRLFILYPNSPTPAFTTRPKLKSILSKKRCRFNCVPSHPNLTPDQASELDFLKFNHSKLTRPTCNYSPPRYVN